VSKSSEQPAKAGRAIITFSRGWQTLVATRSLGRRGVEVVTGDEYAMTAVAGSLRDDFEIELIRAAARRDLPILGICRGCQILNVAFGGTLRNLRNEEVLNKTHLTLSGHSVELVPESRLADILGVTHLEDVISLHGQAVDRPGEGVTIVGTGDGGVAEAVEVAPAGADAWIIGIQWHPELALIDDVQNRLFAEFIDQAREMRIRRLASKSVIEPYLE